SAPRGASSARNRSTPAWMIGNGCRLANGSDYPNNLAHVGARHASPLQNRTATVRPERSEGPLQRAFSSSAFFENRLLTQAYQKRAAFQRLFFDFLCGGNRLAQDLFHCFALGQFIHQLIQ